MRTVSNPVRTVPWWVAATAATVASACAGPEQPATGSLTINLAGVTPDGTEYRLRDATITVTGPDSVQVFHTEDQPDRASLSANVPAGAYSALLDPGWRLERLDAFSEATVNAELISDNPLHFAVDFGQRTVVPLRFRTNISEVDLTQGYDIVLDVEEVAVRGVVVSSFAARGTGIGLAVFAPDAVGDAPPLRTIGGTSTGLFNPTGIWVAGDDIIVAGQDDPSVSVYPRDGSGDLAPTRQIFGLNNELVLPTAIAVYQGEMYVADELSAVQVFPLAASGDVAPTRAITGLRWPAQIAIDRETGELCVADHIAGVVQVFPAGASGAATPVRTLGGPTTGLREPGGVAVFEGELFVSDEATGDIRVFLDFGDGDVAPLRVISTAHMGVGSLGQIAVSRDEIYVVNNVTHQVDVFPINGSGALAPNRSFAGIGTPDAPFEPFGIALF